MASQRKFPLLASEIEFKPRELNVPHKPHHFVSKKVGTLIIIFLCTVLLSLGGTYYLTKHSLREEYATTSPSRSYLPPTTPPDPCAGSKSISHSCAETYSDTGLGITFKYPKNEFYDVLAKTENSVLFGIDSTDDEDVHTLSISTNPRSFTDSKKFPTCNYMRIYGEELNFPCLDRDPAPVTLDGIPSTSFTILYDVDTTKRVIQTTRAPKTELIFQTYDRDQEADFILSTFKFLTNDNERVTTVTKNQTIPNWKTYTNDFYRYSVQYPATIRIVKDNKTYHMVDFDYAINIYVTQTNPESCRGDCPMTEKAVLITLSGLTWKKIKGEQGSIGGNVPQSFVSYVLERNGLYYVFTVYELAYADNPPLERTIQPVPNEKITLAEKMLTTFRFTN